MPNQATTEPAPPESDGRVETIYPAPDGGPDVHLIPRGHRVRTTDHLSRADVRPVPSQPGEKWQAFGQAVLGFHHRVALTAMCRCGRTVVECDVLAQARQHGLLPK